MQPNQHQSKSFKRFIKRWTKRAFTTAVILSIVYIVAVIYSHRYPTVITLPPVTIDNTSTIFAEKIDTLEKAVVENLRACESAGLKESDGLVTFDPTDADFASFLASGKKTIVDKGQMSYGTLQFKKKTVIYYYKTLYSKVITPKEAVLIALDDAKAGELAQDIIFKSKNEANDWTNCANKLSLSAQVKAIKSIK